MNLDSVSIGGFKSISTEHPITLDLKKINVIIGANGCGKSNIITFFKMINFMMSGSFQSYIETNGGPQSFLFYGPKTTPSISANLCFSDDHYKDNYHFSLSYATPDKLIVRTEEVDIRKKGEEKVVERKLETDFKESALSLKQKDSMLTRIGKIIANCKVYQFHDSSATASMRNSSPIEANNYLQAEANNLAAFLYRLKNEYPNSYHNIVSYVKLVVPQFHDFILEPNYSGNVMLKWKDESASDYIFMPHQFSDGSIRFIALATLLLQPKETMPNVVIIDEPELGLHPYAISQLAEMIKDASTKSQIIIATQSPGLIDEFDADDVVVVESLKEKGRNYTQLKRLERNELKDWLEIYTVSDLWDKNIIGGRPI